MILFSVLISVLLGLFLSSTAVDAKTDESLILKIFDPDFRLSDDHLKALLNKADLKSHGYNKEVTIKLVSEPGSDKKLYQEAHFYYKFVDCSLLEKITQELRTLLSGVLGAKLITKANKEFRTKNVTSMKQCKVGLEVHFKDAEGKNNTTRRRGKRGADWCIICINCEASEEV